MTPHCLGLNYRSAPVDVRECFAVPKARLAEAGRELLALPSVAQCVLLSTCNRMEVYFWTEHPEVAEREIREHFLDKSTESRAETHLYAYAGREALKHLCRVLSGLDSMVLGETEIFGQVKEAYRVAHEAGLTGGEANKAFQHAFSIGKKVRRETNIQVGATSIGSVAVELAEQIFGELDGSRVLILGAGEMSRVTAQSLKSRGAKSIFVANRTYERAQELAGLVGGEAIHYEEWIDYLCNIDIVIAATASPTYMITKGLLAPLRDRRKFRSLFLIDIAVPRNIDPAAAEIDEVYVYDIDTLRQLADQARQSRLNEISRCDAIIDEALTKFFPTITKS